MPNNKPSLALPLSIRPYCDGFAIIDDNDMVIAACDVPLDHGHASNPEQNASAIVEACNRNGEQVACSLLRNVLPYVELAAARLADEDKQTDAERGWKLAQRVRKLIALDQNEATRGAS